MKSGISSIGMSIGNGIGKTIEFGGNLKKSEYRDQLATDMKIKAS